MKRRRNLSCRVQRKVAPGAARILRDINLPLERAALGTLVYQFCTPAIHLFGCYFSKTTGAFAHVTVEVCKSWPDRDISLLVLRKMSYFYRW